MGARTWAAAEGRFAPGFRRRRLVPARAGAFYRRGTGPQQTARPVPRSGRNSAPEEALAERRLSTLTQARRPRALHDDAGDGGSTRRAVLSGAKGCDALAPAPRDLYARPL